MSRIDLCFRYIICSVLVYIVYMGLTREESKVLREDIKANYHTQSASVFSERYGITVSAVYCIASQLGVSSSKRWEDDRLNIIREYEDGMSIKELGTRYGHYSGNVTKRLKSWGVNLRDRTESRMEYDFDCDFFNTIDSHEKAYWLGFIYADGNVYINESSHKNVFQIALATVDRGHLEKLRSSLKDSRPIYTDRHNYRYMINHIAFVKDLVKLGVEPRKSLTLTFPDASIVPAVYHNSFILGYFDGDGGFGLYDKKWRFDMIGTIPFVTQCQSIMAINGIVPTKISHETRKADGKLGSIVHGGSIYSSSRRSVPQSRKHVLIKIYRYLYADSPIWLDRKRDLIERTLTMIYNHDWKSST